jgi:hypothetical protein
MTDFSKEEINILLNLFQTELGLEVSEEEACSYAQQVIGLLLATFRDCG